MEKPAQERAEDDVDNDSEEEKKFQFQFPHIESVPSRDNNTII
jgi:hypothetical protein